MNKHLLHNFWKIRLLGFITSSLIVTLANSGLAQIVPDSTLGKENSVVNPNANVRGLPASLIEGGAVRGVNLFQSFSKFNVGDGQRVYFSNPEGIQNILSRITGGDPSKIFGTLGVNGKANLFFLNPNGIIFGSNARLDVAGSFFASTANSFVFENGLKFSATNPETAPLITVSIRPGLQFGGNQSGTISSRANLNAGQDLTLSGVKLDLQGKLEAGKNLTLQATDTVKIRDSIVNPFIASAGGKLVLQGDRNVDIFALNNPNSGFFSGGDMLLRSANTIGGDAHYWAGGNFQIEKLDSNLGNLFSPYDPVIRASGDVNFNNYTGASLHILAGGSVTIGTVNITNADPINGLSQEVRLSDGTALQINGATQPTLDIRAGTTDFRTPGLVPVNFPGVGNVINPNPPNVGSNISNQTQATGAKITIGGINIARSGGQVFLTNQYQPNTNIPGGSIDIIGVSPNSTVGAFSITAFGSPVKIDSRGGVRIAQGVNTSVDNGTAGNIKILSEGDIKVSDNVVSEGLQNDYQGSLISLVNSGNAGDINLGNAGNINLISRNGTIDIKRKIVSSTRNGAAGDISLKANGNININNEIASRILENTTGTPRTAGKIDITSDTGNINLLADTEVASTGELIRKITSSTPNGKGGNITLNAPQNQINATGWTINSKSENGAAGDVELKAGGDIRLGNIEASSNNNNPESFISTVEVISNQGSVFLNDSRLSTSNSGSELAGDISITAREKVSISNSTYLDNTPEIEKKGIFSQGNFGRIFIGASNDVEDANYTSLSPKQVEINKSRLNTSNVVNSQNDPNIIPASDQKIDAGYISIKSEQISLNNDSLLNTQTARKGNAGSVLLEANNGNISLDNRTTISSNVSSKAAGDAGNILIGTNSGAVSLDNESSLQVQTQGTGNAGNVLIETNGGAVSLDNNATIFSSVELGARGNAGSIDIKEAGSVSLKNGAQLQTLVRGQTTPDDQIRNAGNININANGAVTLDNISTLISSELGSGRRGKAGDISITGNSVSLNNGATLSNSTFGDGDAGKVSITSNTGAVSLDNNATIFSSVEPGARGNAGSIDIKEAGSVSLKNGAQLQTLVRDQTPPDDQIRNAGNININANGAVTLDNISTLISSELGSGRRGKAGDISITGNSVSLNNGATLDNSTSGDGNAGKVSITSNTFEALNGSQVRTNTSTNGKAGDIELKVTDNITLSGSRISTDPQSDRNSYYVDYVDDENKLIPIIPSGLFATTREGSTGAGGSISLDPTKLVTIKDSARIAVDSNGSGNAGKITLNANRLTLDNQGKITGDTNSGVGGGIEIKLQDLLLMRRQSLISTQAGEQGAGGNGGNITITSLSNSKPFPFIVATDGENSDILANAKTGQGGRIEIKATGVFGITPLSREQFENYSSFDLQQLNNITAISEQGSPALDGQIIINSPDINFANDLVSLPENPIDASRLIAQSCGTVAGKRSEFINTGRGGLPPRPDEPISSDAIWNDTRLTAIPTPQKIPNTATVSPTKSASAPIIPATGWVFNSKGDVTLVSQVSGANSSLFSSNSSGCRIR